ncbi:methyltransferase domain-containing protein [Actinocorallia sp. API 0066]|uniref:methyltransferase domain-containing protein n=1 Tax=Actinocorallia sp. API 0066 TaxID=2896846 RepID=UPI001E560418|nr:methyltransferase domain-containing protein [Actinocorallia sp. API 0066]MCD0449095.1 methyltransferase domain-containing protein [Actinocorallia sp. API 0066]
MDVWTSVRFRERATGLGDHLAAAGVINDGDHASRLWRTALHEVPRHLFVPDTGYAQAQGRHGASRPIDRRSNTTDWWNAVYEDASIITQRSDGNADVTDTTAPPTCSLSAPTVAVRFLYALGLRDGHRVLDVGTGTGWTSAVLAWRLGDEAVTTIEIDDGLADTAASNLAAAGREPRLVIGDGTAGHPDGGPYDRIHVTAGVRDIPSAWIEQTRPGGLVVLPWMPWAGAWGHLLALDVLGDGTAVGRLTGDGGFMMLRSQRVDGIERQGAATDTVTGLDPRLVAQAEPGAQLAITEATGPLVLDTGWERDGAAWRQRVSVARPGGEGWADVYWTRDAERFDVRQSADVPLWSLVEAAYLGWLRAGRPGRDSYRLTVTPQGQRLHRAG